MFRVNILYRCFLPVYQKSTKKAVNPLGHRGLTAFLFLGCLPDGYQYYFFTLKGAYLTAFLPVFDFFALCENRDTSLYFEARLKPSKILGKMEKFVTKVLSFTVCHYAGQAPILSILTEKIGQIRSSKGD